MVDENNCMNSNMTEIYYLVRYVVIEMCYVLFPMCKVPVTYLFIKRTQFSNAVINTNAAVERMTEIHHI